MRPPLSAIDPFSRGVSIWTRGLSASAASRVMTWAPAGACGPGGVAVGWVAVGAPD